MEYVKPPPPWEAGRQAILNSTGGRVPEHIETEALGWTNGDAYVRLPDNRWRFTSVWLRAEDVKRLKPFLVVEHGQSLPCSPCLPEWP